MRPGPGNAITDVAGLLVGQATDGAARTGVSVLTGPAPFVAAVSVMGGAPGTRETDLLAPDRVVEEVDALVLSGGSAFGLDAAAGVVAALQAEGRGYPTRGGRVPIVPAAILYDLDGRARADDLYRRLGAEAYGAAGGTVALGSVGAGTGATTGGLKGGVGTASAVLGTGHTVGALVAVNAHGSAIVGEGPHFWAAPWEFGDEFGGLGPAPAAAMDPGRGGTLKGAGATTIAIVATDAALTKAQAHRMAIAAQDGIARALVPSHTPYDGDLVFAVSTGARPLGEVLAETTALGHAAASCLARAVARGVWHASAVPGDKMPCWRARFG